jgi:hypothetical protein
MQKWIKNLKWVACGSTLLAMPAVVPVVSGDGLGWTGIDPILRANGHKMNIWVEWPTGRECDIDGPISMQVRGKAVLLAESRQAFKCGLHLNTVLTKTTVEDVKEAKDDKSPNHFQVRGVVVPSSEEFPVRAKVYKNGELAEVCEGVTNQPFNCDKVRLD